MPVLQKRPKQHLVERDLLEVARDKFELISHLEFVDLDRLQQDRNRCAHPSLVSDEEVFTPTAELARLHIRSAVVHLLQYPPAQGKYALEKLLRDVQSDYFPSDKNKAAESLESGPLRNPRESLVRNFVIMLVKKLLHEINEWPVWYRYAAATQAVSKLHRKVFLQTAEDKFSSIVRATPDERLIRVILFLARLGECWEALEVDARTKLENFVLNLPAAHLDNLHEILEIPALEAQAMRRLNKATHEELKKTLFIVLPEAVADRFLELYVESANFDHANDLGKLVPLYASELTEAQQRKLIVGAGKNGQILNSFEVSKVIAALRKTGKIQEEQFEELLAENNLEAYQRAPGA